MHCGEANTRTSLLRAKQRTVTVSVSTETKQNTHLAKKCSKANIEKRACAHPTPVAARTKKEKKAKQTHEKPRSIGTGAFRVRIRGGG